ncbi:MAG: Effector-associated domain 11 [Bacteroidota bacterium]|jgi:hypothetical protein
MIDFLEKQLKKVEQALESLYEQRLRAGIGTVGDYDNRIDHLQQEQLKIRKDLEQERLRQKKIENPIQPLEQTKALSLTKWASEDKLEAVLDALHAMHPTESIILNLTGRLSGLERANRQGILGRSDYNVERASIRVAVFALIKEFGQ